jgi:hypothetical protein
MRSTECTDDPTDHDLDFAAMRWKELASAIELRLARKQ